MIVEILVGITLIFTLINLIINILVLRKVKFNELRMNSQMNMGSQTEGIVFCRKCNNRFPATMQKCPACGEPRK